MTSSEAFTETMVAHGVDNMFGIVGSAFMDALDIFPAAGIRCSRWLISHFPDFHSNAIPRAPSIMFGFC